MRKLRAGQSNLFNHLAVKFAATLIINYLLLIINCQSQWIHQTLPVNKSIVGLEFKDSLKGWAVTNSAGIYDVSYILGTSDGGTNWLLQYTGNDYEFAAFDMVDMSTGYVIGTVMSTSAPVMLKTTNGGINWIAGNPGVGVVFDDIFFTGRDSGFICASFSFAPGLWFTSNGGLSWTARTNGLTGQDVTSLFFMDNNTGWSGDLGGEIHFTTNAGQIWTQIGSFTPSVTSIFFINTSTGWAGYTDDRLRYTSSGGLNWTLQSLPPIGSITDLYFFDNLRGYAGNVTYQILKTYNGGQNWGYQLDSVGSYKFSFVDSLRAWKGDFGIAKTTNGGGPIIYIGFINISNEVPVNFTLHQNYPNPFNPTTTIKLDIPKSSEVNLIICDMLGRELYTITNQFLKAGSYSFTWDARNSSSGIYFYRLSAGAFTQTRKMVLIK